MTNQIITVTLNNNNSEKRHSKMFKCKHCDRTFESAPARNGHEGTHKSKRRPRGRAHRFTQKKGEDHPTRYGREVTGLPPSHRRPAAFNTCRTEHTITDTDQQIENGWKKEHDCSIYSNQFCQLNDESKEQIHLRCEALNTADALQRSQKSNNKSAQLIDLGNAEVDAGNMHEAARIFTHALCFAVCGTSMEGRAHERRGSCFQRLSLLKNAQLDFDLATKKMCPEALNSEHVNSIKNQNQSKDVQSTRMTLPANEQFPCMANVLDMKYLGNFKTEIKKKNSVKNRINTVFF